MTDSKAAWNDAGSKLSDLGRKLKQHYDDESSGQQGQTEVKDAISRLGTAVQDVFDALGKAAKDPDVKTDVKQVGQSLTEALGATFAEVSDDLRRSFGSKPGSATTSSEPPTAQPTATEPPKPAPPAAAGSTEEPPPASQI